MTKSLNTSSAFLRSKYQPSKCASSSCGTPPEPGMDATIPYSPSVLALLGIGYLSVSPLRTFSPSGVSLYRPERVSLMSLAALRDLMQRRAFILFGSPLCSFQPMLIAIDEQLALGLAWIIA